MTYSTQISELLQSSFINYFNNIFIYKKSTLKCTHRRSDIVLKAGALDVAKLLKGLRGFGGQDGAVETEGRVTTKATVVINSIRY